MDISIDMLKVGNADALIVWLKDSQKNSHITVIDGGNSEDGESVIAHLENYILPNVSQNAPDLIISTHHDKDHINGLIKLVEKYIGNIGEVWVNNPADYVSSYVFESLKSKLRNKSYERKYQYIQESLNNLDDFITIVDRYNILRESAFSGKEKFNNIIKVLGPSKSFYESMLPGFENLEEYISEQGDFVYNSRYSEAVINETLEANSSCSIVDKVNSTSASNNSSVITEFNINNKRFLFTGDTGVAAFNSVEERYSLENIYWLDVPHHGSRRNLTSTLIDTMNADIGYISAVGNKKHPRRALVNCLKRAGTKVYSTHKSGNIWYHNGDFPNRPNYNLLQEL